MNDRESIFKKPLEAAMTHAMSYLTELGRSPVGARASAAALRHRLVKPLSRSGEGANE